MEHSPKGAEAFPPEAAKEAGLREVSDGCAGIARSGSTKAFRYRGSHGWIIRGAETLGRIRRLAIPPAWTKVWICPIANGHIQATGSSGVR